MKCKQAQTLIDAHIDGELLDSIREQLEAHVQACPSCRKEMSRARTLDALTRSYPSDPSPRLQDRMAAAIREPVNQNPMQRFKETLTMKTTLGIRVGLTTVLATGLIAGGLILLPQRASANTAKELWAKMTKEASAVSAVHITNVWNEGNGKVGRTQIWTDGKSIRMDEADGTINTCKDGNFRVWTPAKPGSSAIGEGAAMSSGMDPAIFTLPIQLKMLSAGASEPMDFGSARANGLSFRKVGIINQAGNERHTFWINTATNLPTRKVDEQLQNGKWIEVGYQEFEFLAKLDPSLFTVGGRLVSSPPKGGAGTVLGGGN